MTAVERLLVCQHNTDPQRIRPHRRWQNGVVTFFCEECYQAELHKQEAAKQRRAEELMGRWPE